MISPSRMAGFETCVVQFGTSSCTARFIRTACPINRDVSTHHDVRSSRNFRNHNVVTWDSNSPRRCVVWIVTLCRLTSAPEELGSSILMEAACSPVMLASPTTQFYIPQHHSLNILLFSTKWYRHKKWRLSFYASVDTRSDLSGYKAIRSDES